MADLIIMRGISGSGKSTVARARQRLYPDTVIVSRDDLRLALHGQAFGNNVNEHFITDVEHHAVETAMGTYRADVIVDNTNLKQQFVDTYFELADRFDYTPYIKEVDTPLSLAIARNFSRSVSGGRFVPERVIQTQHKLFQSKITNPYGETIYL